MSTVGMPMSLLSQLYIALEKEQTQLAQWYRQGGLQQGEQLVTIGERDDAVAWLCHLSNVLVLGPDTLALAASILDRTLSTTRVQTKYLRVLALSGFYVACKICEEPEAVPPIPDLVREAGLVCSVQELVRMERVLLKRLNWDLSLVTPYSFIQLMLAINLSPEIGPALTCYLRPCLEKVTCSADLFLLYRPSLLAAGLLSVTLERQRHPHWFAITVSLQQMISVPLEKIIACREHLLARLWPHERLLQEQKVNDENAGALANSTRFSKQQRRPFDGEDDAEMKPFERQQRFDDDAENVRPSKTTTTGYEQRGSRKRQRRKSKCSSSSSSYEDAARVKTAPDQMYIDEIYDAVHVLYGLEKFR